MSLQSGIEQALADMLSKAILGLEATIGPKPVPVLEGSTRFASVRQTDASATRIEFGQSEIAENYRLTVYWSKLIARGDVFTEWATFRAALIADPQLGDTHTGVTDAYVSTTAWGEAHDAPHRTMQADVTIERVE